MRRIPRFIAPMTVGDVAFAIKSRGERNAQEKFESAFARYIGVDHAVTAPSGRFAFSSILASFGFPRGGEVIVPALTFYSMTQMIKDAGLVPVFVDIVPGAYVMDPARIPAAVTDKTVAILPTHLYGRACDMNAIMDVAASHDLKVIEDCAQACGGRLGGRRLGSIGHAALYSFGPTKNLAMLWAGMVITNDPSIADSVKSKVESFRPIPALTMFKRLLVALAMRSVTSPLFWNIIMEPALRLFAAMGADPIEKLTVESPGDDNKANDNAMLMPRPFQMNIGISQLHKLDDSNGRRMKNGEELLGLLQDTPEVQTPVSVPKGENIFMSFPVLLENRDYFRKKMLANGVDTATGYMGACPGEADREKAFKNAPFAFAAIEKMVHLPIYPELDSSDIRKLADAAIKALK